MHGSIDQCEKDGHVGHHTQYDRYESQVGEVALDPVGVICLGMAREGVFKFNPGNITQSQVQGRKYQGKKSTDNDKKPPPQSGTVHLLALPTINAAESQFFQDLVFGFVHVCRCEAGRIVKAQLVQQAMHHIKTQFGPCVPGILRGKL